MSDSALIVTYHAIEVGPPPLCIPPDLFAVHLDCLLECGAQTMTISELARASGRGEFPDRAVAITFDDGFRSVATEAAPRLAERGMSATVFAVAGHLGAENDWPTQPSRAPRLALADASELAELGRSGFEIGSHGMYHVPLTDADESVARVELERSRARLEQILGAPVRTFAYPYGAAPSAAARATVQRTYDSAALGPLARVQAGENPYSLPRVDAHYLRRPELLRSAAVGSLGLYLRARRLGARARRAFVDDWA